MWTYLDGVAMSFLFVFQGLGYLMFSYLFKVMAEYSF